MIDSGADDVLLLDVRNPSEVNVAVIANSFLIPLSFIENGEKIDHLRNIVENKRLFIYCKVGARSAKAVKILAKFGISAINVDGGIDAWAEQIDPYMIRY